MERYNLSIPMRLAVYRKLMHLSQTEMGEKLGVTQSHYCKQESGMKGVSFRNLKCFEENGGDPFFLITGEHRAERKLERYLECCTTEYGRQRIFEILIWAAEEGQVYIENGTPLISERTSKCLKLLRGYVEELTIWKNIRRAEGYSQEKMAEIFDINVKRYRSIEKGNSFPDAEILKILYEKLMYSPLIVLNREMYYMDELNRIWEMLPQKYIIEMDILINQAIQLVHISENRKMENKE